jgi:3-oxoacyl-[acyl-carrier protein] reductase
MFDLTGKIALVTGATGVIGGAIARTLHEMGATLAVSGTRVDSLENLAAELIQSRSESAIAPLSSRDCTEIVQSKERGTWLQWKKNLR